MAQMLLKGRDVLLECQAGGFCHPRPRHYYWLSLDAGQPTLLYMCSYCTDYYSPLILSRH